LRRAHSCRWSVQAAIRAAQHATQAIPIVGMTDDMVGSGLAASLAQIDNVASRKYRGFDALDILPRGIEAVLATMK